MWIYAISLPKTNAHEFFMQPIDTIGKDGSNDAGTKMMSADSKSASSSSMFIDPLDVINFTNSQGKGLTSPTPYLDETTGDEDRNYWYHLILLISIHIIFFIAFFLSYFFTFIYRNHRVSKLAGLSPKARARSVLANSDSRSSLNLGGMGERSISIAERMVVRCLLISARENLMESRSPTRLLPASTIRRMKSPRVCVTIEEFMRIASDDILTEELREIFATWTKCIQLRHKYMDMSLQAPGDNPKDEDGWRIYPEPPEPSYIPKKGDNVFHEAPVRKPESETFDFSECQIPDTSDDRVFKLSSDGVFRVYQCVLCPFNTFTRSKDETQTPCFSVPSVREYFMDLEFILNVISDGIHLPQKKYN